MSDFDDEPTEGTAANDEVDDAPEPRSARSQPVPDDDWDDEDVAPRRKTRAKAAVVEEDDDDWDDDWDDDDRGGPKRDMTVVWAIVAAAIVIVIAVVLTRPSDSNSGSDGGGQAGGTTAPTEIVKNWQGDVADAVGKDGADAQARAEAGEGVYIWTDFGGWHLRANGDQEVTVKVAADQVKVQGGDEAFATETDVTLPAGDGKTGADLDLGNSESVTFTVSIGGTNVPADQIFLGGAEGVADQNPVTFTKA